MAPHPMHRDAGAGPGRQYCKYHELHFHTFGLYMKHLIDAQDHFPCVICHIDYASPEALDRHMKQNHAHEQDVKCVGCKKSFNRIGGLVSHIELKQCPFVKSGLIQDLRAANPHNSGRLQEIKAASQAQYVKERVPATVWEKDATAELISAASGSSPAGKVDAVKPWVEASAFELSEDLIDMTDPSAIMNAPWDEYPTLQAAGKKAVGSGGKASAKDKPTPSIISSNTFSPAEDNASQSKLSTTAPAPAGSVGIKPKSTASAKPLSPVKVSSAASPSAAPAWGQPVSTSASSPPAVPAWGRSNVTSAATLFPDALPPVAPSPEVLADLTTAAERKPVFAEHDPTNPNFNPERYYCNFAQGYRCPNKVGSSSKKCMKVQKNVQAFLAHLRSPVHMDLQAVACPQCLRPFSSSTAVTQHFESQAIRCNARKLGHADVLVKDLTQILVLGGEFADETNKYVNNPSFKGAGLNGATIAQNATDFNRNVDEKVDGIKKKAEERFHRGNW